MKFHTLLAISAMMLPAAAMAQPTQTPSESTTSPTSTESTAPQQEPSTEPSPSTEATTQDSATSQAPAGAVVAATTADVKPGAVVNDQTGQNVGKIESVTSQGAVISTGKSRAQVPLTAFAKSGEALVIAMTKDELDAAVAAQKPSS